MKTQARVLILTPEAFNRVTGTGITFSNLFTGWPREAIATIHSGALPVTTDVCDRYFQLTAKEIHRWGWLKYLFPKNPARKGAVVPSVMRRWGFIKPIFKKIKTLVFGDGIPEQVQLSPELCVWIEEFQPNVLYTILGSNAMMELAERLRVRYALPLVVHIMDDWVSVLYQKGLLSHLQRRKKERLFKYLVEVASARLAICEEMASSYRQRYGQPFQSFQNTIELSALQKYIKNPETIGSPVRVAYIGSIFPNAQLDSLIDCCKAVQQLHDENDLITMEIYSPKHLAEKYRTELVLGEAISMQDTMTDDKEFFATLQAVDILVLPVNFDPDTVAFIRYSMPTKVPAYLAVGTPILAYGPGEVAQITYAIEAGWAVTVTERDIARLKQAFRRLAEDVPLRNGLFKCAQDAAQRNHDSNIVRSGFQAALHRASSLADRRSI